MSGRNLQKAGGVDQTGGTLLAGGGVDIVMIDSIWIHKNNSD